MIAPIRLLRTRKQAWEQQPRDFQAWASKRRNLAWRVENRLDVMAVRVDDESRVIMWAIIRPGTGRAIVTATMSECGGMEESNALAIRSREGQMKTRAGWTLTSRAKLDGQLVTAASNTITHGLIRFARVEILPDATIAKRRKHGVIECSRALDIRNPERHVVKHVAEILVFDRHRREVFAGFRSQHRRSPIQAA
jgi:hypothetical protein